MTVLELVKTQDKHGLTIQLHIYYISRSIATKVDFTSFDY